MEVEGESLREVFQLLHKQQHGCGASLGGIFDLVSTFWPECVNGTGRPCEREDPKDPSHPRKVAGALLTELERAEQPVDLVGGVVVRDADSQ